jgi:transcriptional regulator with XRE-family HTH domain
MLSAKNGIVQRVRARRKEAKLSQLELAQKSGISFGSFKRFENSGEISLSSLIKIAFALGYESDFQQLFSRKNYQSLDEIINEKE